jgi:hypothetical protein
MTNHDDANLVSPDNACPVCGERDVDRLVWIDDDIVRCTMCGTEYDPLKSRPRNEGNNEQR